jgi:heme-degrading monooxygenase HmoA
MIERIWHGWTAPEDAAAYERVLRERIVPEIEAIEGCRGMRILRRPDGEAVEFVTVIRFESMDAVRAFAGEDHRQAHVPEPAREVLTRWNDHVDHYEVRERYEW